jgi:hypothetical protein
MKELPTPSGLKPDARELLRVWASDENQRIILRANEWSDAAAWGLMLVDIARHAAKAFSQQFGGTYDEALSRIREGFDAEWESPTD